MPNLIFIREIDPNTYLHYSYLAETARLRDYSRGPYAPPEMICGYTTQQIQKLLQNEGTRLEKAPDHRVDDYAFWHNIIRERNDLLYLSGNDKTGCFTRLLDQFHAEIAPFVRHNNKRELSERLQIWRKKLERIVTKNSTFNHWDNDDASGFPINEGIGWASRMLEFSREENKLQFIRTDDESLDFSLLSIETNMSISANNNPFVQGARSSINLDGLGIRRDGTFCVIEIKAEADTHELFRATVQALCGAVAVVAKQKMICNLVEKAAGRRPAFISPALLNKSSIGLYVMVDSRHYYVPEGTAFIESISILIDAFPPLSEVVYFSVNPQSEEFPSKISLNHVIKRQSNS
ncbi:MAG: hypothetical protein R3B84_15960 [Zavarzinella sp.]